MKSLQLDHDSANNRFLRSPKSPTMSQGIVPLALRLRACLWRGWQIGTPAHVVVKKDSRVEILAGKVLVTWEEGKDGIGLGVADDIWVKVRIDGKKVGFTAAKTCKPSASIERARRSFCFLSFDLLSCPYAP
jgi:hypothetical protein